MTTIYHAVRKEDKGPLRSYAIQRGYGLNHHVNIVKIDAKFALARPLTPKQKAAGLTMSAAVKKRSALQTYSLENLLHPKTPALVRARLTRMPEGQHTTISNRFVANTPKNDCLESNPVLRLDQSLPAVDGEAASRLDQLIERSLFEERLATELDQLDLTANPLLPEDLPTIPKKELGTIRFPGRVLILRIPKRP